MEYYFIVKKYKNKNIFRDSAMLNDYCKSLEFERNWFPLNDQGGIPTHTISITKFDTAEDAFLYIKYLFDNNKTNFTQTDFVDFYIYKNKPHASINVNKVVEEGKLLFSQYPSTTNSNKKVLTPEEKWNKVMGRS